MRTQVRRMSYALSVMSVTALTSAVLTVPAVGQDDGPILDPLPDPTLSNLALTLEPFAQLPDSQPDVPPTDARLQRTNRINYVGEVPDGSGRLYVPDLNGMMYLIDDGEPVDYLDVGAEFRPYFWNHAGLGSGFGFVTFHPDFADNGKFYTVHTEGNRLDERPQPDLPHWPQITRHGVITEWTADDPAASTFAGSNRELLRVGHRTNIHGFQEIGFNPTANPGDEDYGLLYVAMGDGGGATFTDVAQDLGTAEGTIMRIDPLGDDSSNGQYGIPASNPFVDDPDALDEIYAYGLRNPHRFSWDPKPPHRMYLGHIGEWQIESIYEVRKGDNFGWAEREGPFVIGDDRWLYPLPDNDAEFGYTYPVAAYDHNRQPGQTGDLGIAVVGGFAYRGSDIPLLNGLYIFGDIVSGQIFFARADQLRQERDKMAPIQEFLLQDEHGNPVTMQDLTGLDRIDLRFGQDSTGQLYVSSKGSGSIWKITDAKRVPPGHGKVTVTDVMNEADWAPITPSKWQFTGEEVILAEAGSARPGPRRPFEYAILTEGPEWRKMEVEAQVRVDVPTPIGRDVIVFFGWQSDTEFYYAHLSEDTGNYVHNGIFVVNNADRERIDDQWDGTTSAPAAIAPGMNWHDVRVTHNGASGKIAVYVDGGDEPLMTATDDTFATGRVGFGSFDDTGRIRDLTVSGLPAR
jgi:glucose/arabinose dehydrogenase